jgi:hypothetical protein
MDDIKPDWTLEEGHLLHKNQLVVPDKEDLYAQLLDKIYQQVSIIYPGQMKTKSLVGEYYY